MTEAGFLILTIPMIVVLLLLSLPIDFFRPFRPAAMIAGAITLAITACAAYSGNSMEIASALEAENSSSAMDYIATSLAALGALFCATSLSLAFGFVIDTPLQISRRTPVFEATRYTRLIIKRLVWLAAIGSPVTILLAMVIIRAISTHGSLPAITDIILAPYLAVLFFAPFVLWLETSMSTTRYRMVNDRWYSQSWSLPSPLPF